VLENERERGYRLRPSFAKVAAHPPRPIADRRPFSPDSGAMPDLLDAASLLLRLLPPEVAHRAAVRALAAGLAGGQPTADDPILATTLWGRRFANPIGLAAGFDKSAEAYPGAPALGFGFLEVGSVTPRPQPGNPRPRLFRLAADGAAINRMGFNNDGAATVAARLAARPPALPLGVNLGKNKDSADAAADYADGARRLAGNAAYLVINVSSPNTPGLRALQNPAALAGLIEAVRGAISSLRTPPPLLVKIAPDLAPEDEHDIAALALASSLDGLVVSNTTTARPATLRSAHRDEAGGLSGRPLFAPSTALLGRIYRLTEGRVPLVGVGGIASGADAYAKIRAGASLLQLYTALLYAGPGLVRRIKRDLARRLRADGFASLGAAVGADHRQAARPATAR
jgi:dihydroorotate dehydrogenase